MLEFKKPKLTDKQWIDDCIAAGSTEGCWFCFGTLYGWSSAYDFKVCRFKDFLLIKGKAEQGNYYAYPTGSGDIKEAILALEADSAAAGEYFFFCQLTEENTRELESLFPGKYKYIYNRDSSEYVYNVKDMDELPGKKYHGKKGHIKAFFKNHSDIHCDPITADNICDCIEIEKAWLSSRDDEYGELSKEFQAMEPMLKGCKEIGLSGAVLYADGKAVAFTLGEPMKNNTFCIHYEKAHPDYRDAYPVINNGFIKLMLRGYDYVNREEDTGSPGLRKAKLAYHPAFLLNKYNAILRENPQRKYRAEKEDKPQLKALWQTVFGDSDTTVDFFFDSTEDICDVLALQENGKILSAFYVIDAQIKSGGELHPVGYIYAAATLPEHRGEGIMGELLRYCKEIYDFSGYHGLFLYPAEKSLYNYYDKFGFKKAFSERIYKINKGQLEEYKNAPYYNCSVSYENIRDAVAADSMAVFPGGYLDFARYCAAGFGFERAVVFEDEDRVYLTGHFEDGNAYITEAISANGNYTHILNVISDLEFTECAYLKTPINTVLECFPYKEAEAGMLLDFEERIEDKNIYMGQPCM